MGYLRFYLALVVVATHAIQPIAEVHSQNWLQIFSGVGGYVAVETFFVVSGFYMAMILSGSYADRPGAFYLNRALRIYPIYWLCLIAYLLAGQGRSDGGLIYWVTNILGFGNDSISTSLLGAKDLGPVISPAWTLAIELPFYTLAPFIVKLGSRVLAVLIAALLSLKIFFVFQDPSFGNFLAYRSVVFEFAFFFVGILLWRSRQRIQVFFESKSWLLWLVLGVSVIAAPLRFVAGSVGGDFLGLFVMPTALVAVTALTIPYLMKKYSESKWDRRFGNLSYPLYLSHLLVVEFFVSWRNASVPNTNDVLMLGLVTVLTVLAAVGLHGLDSLTSRLRNAVRGTRVSS